MNDTFDNTAVETIDLLEARLKRIEYAVRGHIDETAPARTEDSAYKRLADLEHALHELASKSKVVQDLLRLQTKFPDLFQSIRADEIPSTLDFQSVQSIVLASASAYPSTSSRLTSILDVPIPAAELSTQLIDLQPRIAKVEALQAAQAAEIAALRQRSAAVLQRWYAVDILRTGETWAELEGRVELVEQSIRRTTRAKRDDEMI